MHWISIALGGALGAVCRYWVSLSLLPVSSYKFPFATLSVNVAGSLLMGLLYVLIVEKGGLPDEARHILMIGFLGAFTTFSTFSLDAISLWQNGAQLMALIYVVSSVALCLIAIIFAIWLTRLF
jgi:CrcB protein